MATFTLTVSGYHVNFPESSIWDVIGVPTTEISELFDVLEYLYKSGQIDSGVICLTETGEVVGYAENGEIVAVG